MFDLSHITTPFQIHLPVICSDYFHLPIPTNAWRSTIHFSITFPSAVVSSRTKNFGISYRHSCFSISFRVSAILDTDLVLSGGDHDIKNPLARDRYRYESTRKLVIDFSDRVHHRQVYLSSLSSSALFGITSVATSRILPRDLLTSCARMTCHALSRTFPK